MLAANLTVKGLLTIWIHVCWAPFHPAASVFSNRTVGPSKSLSLRTEHREKSYSIKGDCNFFWLTDSPPLVQESISTPSQVLQVLQVRGRLRKRFLEKWKNWFWIPAQSALSKRDTQKNLVKVMAKSLSQVSQTLARLWQSVIETIKAQATLLPSEWLAQSGLFTQTESVRSLLCGIIPV